MAWGLGVGMLIVGIMFAFFAVIIFKEMRTHRFWRSKVEEGDLEMIRQLVEGEVERWIKERPPKGISGGVWQGVQGAELVAVGVDYIHVSTTAEPHFATIDGVRRQVSGALEEAKWITGRLAERLFYDVPHVRPDRVQIDIYTTFHEVGGEVNQRCIMSTLAERQAAADIDWDDDSPESIAATLGARYQVDERGLAAPIEPAVAPLRPSADGAPPDGSQDAG